MNENLKKLKIIFYAILSQFVIISIIVYSLKSMKIVEDVIKNNNKLLMIVPAIMLILILVAFLYYDRLAKKSKALENEDEQFAIFKNAMIIKLAVIDLVGLLTAVMMFLIYIDSYLYMLGIIFVFFLLSAPSEQKFRKDFIEKKNRLFE